MLRAAMKKKHYIDAHKAATGPIVLAMIALHGAWDSPTAWVYLALHGSYGFLWLLKSRIFPDKSWEAPASLGSGLYIWGVLSLYFAAPWIVTSQHVEVPPWYLAACVAIFAFGVFFHFTADMQKHVQLRLRPGQLMTDGLVARVRNINYFGEFLIYFSFALLSMHWLPLAIQAGVLAYWLGNMRAKDRSLNRYPEFAEYRRRSKMFVPFLY
jgi:steroid 5-alpha reductase family enzyme